MTGVLCIEEGCTNEQRHNRRRCGSCIWYLEERAATEKRRKERRKARKYQVRPNYQIGDKFEAQDRILKQRGYGYWTKPAPITVTSMYEGYIAAVDAAGAEREYPYGSWNFRKIG